MINLDKRLTNIEAMLSMLVKDQSKLVTDNELEDTRIEIFHKIGEMQRDTLILESQLDLLEKIILDIQNQQGR